MGVALFLQSYENSVLLGQILSVNFMATKIKPNKMITKRSYGPLIRFFSMFVSG